MSSRYIIIGKAESTDRFDTKRGGDVSAEDDRTWEKR